MGTLVSSISSIRRIANGWDEFLPQSHANHLNHVAAVIYLTKKGAMRVSHAILAAREMALLSVEERLFYNLRADPLVGSVVVGQIAFMSQEASPKRLQTSEEKIPSNLMVNDIADSGTLDFR